MVEAEYKQKSAVEQAWSEDANGTLTLDWT